MRIRQGVADVLQQPHGFTRAERTRACDARRETLALDERHGEGEHLGCVFHREHRDDVRVREARGRACLAEESRAQAGIDGELRRQDLQGDRAIELPVPREVHGPHAPPTEFPLDGVAVAKGGPQGFERRDGHLSSVTLDQVGR